MDDENQDSREISRRGFIRQASSTSIGLLSAGVAVQGLSGCDLFSDDPPGNDGEEKIVRARAEGGDFVAGGERLFPHGFNYIELRRREDGVLRHDTFNPGRPYSSQEAEEALSRMADSGFNIARVFIDQSAGPGVAAEEPTETRRLDAAYMENVFDFLELARSYGIYVLPTFPYIAESYDVDYRIVPDGVGGANQLQLSQGHIDAKGRYLADFAQAIKNHNPELLPVIFAYELENETNLKVDKPPFSLDEGTVTPANGTAYDVSSDQELANLRDESINYWANALAGAIREIDPEAMVSVDVFTYEAVDRSGPLDFASGAEQDPRIPARPLTLLDSELDYVDIHMYPNDMSDVDEDLGSIEFPEVQAKSEAEGMPLFLGEFGVHKQDYSVSDGADFMVRFWDRLADEGFDGFAYWTYKGDKQIHLWTADAGNWEIFRALAKEASRPQ